MFVFPFLFNAQRSVSFSNGELNVFAVRKIHNHTKKYQIYIQKSRPRKSSRRFIFKKGKTFAPKRRRR